MKKLFFKVVRVALSLLIIVNSFLTYNTINADDPIADLEINDFGVRFIDGAVLESNKYTWNAESPTAGHPFVFQINFALSGQYSIDPYNVELRIPLHILKDRNGNYADDIEMSIPSKKDVDDGVSISPDINYCYFIENNEIVIQNFREYHTGENAFIQVKYLTSKSTLEYVDNAKSEPFKATIKASINNALGNIVEVSDTSSEIPVYINTTSKIVQTSKRTPDLYEEWDNSWGTPIEDADKYNYLIWPIHTSFLPNLTQPFDFYLTEQANKNRLLGNVVGYKMQGEATFSNVNFALNQNSPSTRIDYVLTSHDKDLWETDREKVLFIENSIQAHLNPIDRKDPTSFAFSNGTYDWRYEIPSFVYPPGHFMSHKRADRSYDKVHDFDYLGMKAGEYSRYDLHKFLDGRLEYLNNLDYAVWAGGYPYPWTIGDKEDTDPNAYGSHKVKFEIIDETFILYEEASDFPNPNVGLDDDTYGIPVITNETFVLDYNDFQIDTLAFDVEIKDAYYNEKSMSFIEKNSGAFLDDDVLIFYGRFNDDPTYIQIASKNLLTGEYTFDQDYISNMYDRKILFKDGVNCVGYKVTTESNHYYIKIKCVPNIRLKNSQRVLDYIKDMYSIAILNSETANFYDYTGKKIGNRSESEVNYITKSEDRTRSYIEKTIKSTSNSVNYRQYRINWNINVYDKLIIDNTREEYIIQNGGTFYDLLPSGAILDQKSITVYNGPTKIDSSYYSISTIDNYNDTGRTLLIVDINYDASIFALSFDTIHSWDTIFDWGKNIYNPVIYKTGNEEMSEINPGYRGENKQKDLFNDIIDEFGEKRFLFADTSFDISIISAAAANLHKKVKDSNDSDYSYDTWTSINGDYSYRLRFQNTTATKSKDIVLFDSLENYIEKQKDGTYLNSEWHGTLKSIDISQLIHMGIKPEIYLSSIDKLVIENNHDISDKNVWKKMSEFGDISKAKAIAIDCRKDVNGNDYVLPSSASIEAVLYMKAPDVFQYQGNEAPRSFNNVYIEDTIIDSNGRETHFFIHQDYTIIRYRITSDLKIHKVNSDDLNESISNVSYLLQGTSFYGNKIESIKTTNAGGFITFEDLEQGEYELMEVDCPDDWVLDKTVHKVVVKNDGTLWVDGIQINELGSLTLTNTRRIHGNLKLLKIKEGSTVKQKEIISKILAIEPKSEETVRIDKKDFYVLVKDEENKRALLAQNEEFLFHYYTGPINTPSLNYSCYFWVPIRDKYIESGNSKRYNDLYLQDKPELEKMIIKSEFPVYGSEWIRDNYNEEAPIKIQESVKYIYEKVAPLSYSDFEHNDIGLYADYTYNDNFIISKDDTFLWDLFKLTALRTSEYISTFRHSPDGVKSLLAYINDDLDHAAFADNHIVKIKIFDFVMSTYPEWYPTPTLFPAEVNPKDDTQMDYYIRTIPTFWIDLSGVEADSPVSGTTFKLEGISDYGNDMTSFATSDDEGHLSFDNIEKGHYTLKEVVPNDDYILNESVWDVYVNEDGSVVVNDPSFALRDRLYHADYSNGEWIIHNEPRYWSFEIDKVLKNDHNTHISGVTFNLSGISELRTVVDINATTDENGIAKFEGIEKGKYALREVSIDNDEYNYYLNNDTYSVVIDYTGNVRISELEKKAKNSYYFENDVINDGELIITKKWNDYVHYHRETPKIHISTKPLDELSSLDQFDNNGVRDLGNGDFEYITFNDKWIKNGLITQYYKFEGLDNSRKYYIYEEPISGYTSEAISNYIIVNEGELDKAVTIENNRTNSNKLYVSKKVEPGYLYSASVLDEGIVVHSDNIDDDGFMLSQFRSTVSVVKHGHIEGAEMLDVVISAGVANNIYIFSGDPNDPNSKAYNMRTSDADFVISKPLGRHEDNTYHFRIEGEYITIYYSSTYNSDSSDKYGFFASVKPVGRRIGEAAIPDDIDDKEYTFKITIDYYTDQTLYIDDVLFMNGTGYFTLKDGETKVFNNFPPVTYHLSEVGDIENYETTYKTNSTRNHTITNRYMDIEKTNLTLRKETTGNFITNDSYNYEIYFFNLENDTKYSVNNGDSFKSTQDGDAVYSVSLKSDEEIVIEDIPYGTKYRIREVGGDYVASYQITDENNGSIEKDNEKNYVKNKDLSTETETISNGEKNTVIFTNEINKYQNLKVSKNVIGEYNDFEFAFDLLIENLLPNFMYETSLGKFTSDENGVIDRTIMIKHGEIFEANDLPINATYSVEENDYLKDGFIASVSTNSENTTITGRKASGTITYGENVDIKYVNVERGVVSGSKSWLDGGLSHDNPNEIKLELTRYSIAVDKHVVNVEPVWEDNTFYYVDLDLNDEFDNPYTYEVKEKDIDDYSSTVDGFNLINTKDKGSLIISKKVEGELADENKEFTFTIKLTNKENKPVSGNFSGVVFDEDGIGIVKLKHNQKVEIELYKDINYEISEDPQDYVSNIDVVKDVIGDETKQHDFINTKTDIEKPDKKVNGKKEITIFDYDKEIVYTVSQVVPGMCKSFIIKDDIPEQLNILSYSVNDDRLNVTRDGQLIKVECNEKELLNSLSNKTITLTIMTKINKDKLKGTRIINNTADVEINNIPLKSNDTYVIIPPSEKFKNPKTAIE